MALAALPYHEPGIVTILIQASFLIVLNGIDWILDNAIYCGLVGQILIGVAWGTPGANWLSPEVQDTVMQLGYLGLILIVYEGMSTLKLLRGYVADFAFDRWLVNFIRISLVQYLSLWTCGPHRHYFAHWHVIRLAGITGSHSSSSFCCWSCVVFDFPRYNIHYS